MWEAYVCIEGGVCPHALEAPVSQVWIYGGGADGRKWRLGEGDSPVSQV